MRTPPDEPAGPQLPEDAQLWLIRHGETAWSASGRHTGRTDVALTAAGVEQAEALRPLLADVRPVLVLTSPRTRARHTAELAGFPGATPCPDLAEWDYGDYEGLTSAEIRERADPDWTIFRGVVPHGENAESVGARADRVLAQARTALPDGPVLLFGHGHLNRVLAARWLGQPVRAGEGFALGTAAPCLLGVQHSRAVIVRWNLPNPAATG
jgi:probable phosphoglycerate mutase